MSTTEDENKEIARQCTVAVINEGDLSVIDDHMADDFVGYDSAAPEPIRGPEGAKEFVEMNRTAFPDLEVAVEDVIAEDDEVVIRYSATGTHDGELMGIEPTGKEVEMEGIVIARIEDGKIVERWGQTDMLGVLQQLGVVEL